MRYLKEDTQVTVQIGPFLDATDGKTAETGLTINDTDVYISKNDGDFDEKNDNTDPVSTGQGFYKCELDTTDTSTTGHLVLICNVAGALPVWHEFTIVHANVYDSLFGADGADLLEVDVQEWNGDSSAVTVGGNSGKPEVDTYAVSDDATAANNLETMLDGTGGQTFSLGKLVISGDDAGGVVNIDNANNAGAAVDINGHVGIHATGAGEEGVLVDGNTNGVTICGFGGHGLQTLTQGGGDYHGIYAEGASTDSGNSGHGIKAVGGTSTTSGIGGHGVFADAGDGAGTDNGGHGIFADAGAAAGSGGSHGIFANGVGTGAGLNATGESGGNGIYATGGIGFNIVGLNTHGMKTAAASGDGIRAEGADGHGFYALGAGTGNGIYAYASGTSATAGIYARGNDTADGIRAHADGSQGNGFRSYADGQGHGIYAKGGDGISWGGAGIKAEAGDGPGTPHGIEAVGDGAGSGFSAAGGPTNGNGIYALAEGSGSGIFASASQSSGTGAGIQALGGDTSGSGIEAQSQGGNDEGIYAIGNGSGAGIGGTGGGSNGPGIRGTGGVTNGPGIRGSGRGTGAGIFAEGDGEDNSIGILAKGYGTGSGIKADGVDTGHGIEAEGGNTGNGINATGGSTDGSAGFYGTSQATNGIGMLLEGPGTGKDIDADEIDAIPTLSTTVDGTPLETIYEYVMGMANGKYEVDVPEVGNVRFYKRDNNTELFTVDVTKTSRTRV